MFTTQVETLDANDAEVVRDKFSESMAGVNRKAATRFNVQDITAHTDGHVDAHYDGA